jgi:hypothetical protein
MDAGGPAEGGARIVVARLLATFLLLFAQILGATFAGASLAVPSRIELCTGRGEPVTGTLPDDGAPAEHRHELCTGCLACPAKLPPPPLVAVPWAGPLVLSAADRPDLEGVSRKPLRAVRPPGRAPPTFS